MSDHGPIHDKQQPESRKPLGPASTPQEELEDSYGAAAGLGAMPRVHEDKGTLTPANLITLQRTIGNRAVQRLVERRRGRTPAVQRADNKPAGGSATKAAKSGDVLKVEVKAGPNIQLLDAVKNIKDWDKLTARLGERGLDEPGMVDLCAEYVLALQNKTTAKTKAKYLLGQINQRMKDARAFERRTGDAASKSYSGQSGLWTGAKGQAEKFAEQSGGITLELSMAGSMFDGLDFGIGSAYKWDESPLKYQWDEFSRLYGEGIRGQVHVHQYRGVRKASIFNLTEWPAMQGAIAKGLVEPLFHVYANWGAQTGESWGTPVYEDRKEERTETDFNSLPQWEFGDALEKAGGYWPPGVPIGTRW